MNEERPRRRDTPRPGRAPERGLSKSEVLTVAVLSVESGGFGDFRTRVSGTCSHAEVQQLSDVLQRLLSGLDPVLSTPHLKVVVGGSVPVPNPNTTVEAQRPTSATPKPCANREAGGRTPSPSPPRMGVGDPVEPRQHRWVPSPRQSRRHRFPTDGCAPTLQGARCRWARCELAGSPGLPTRTPMRAVPGSKTHKKGTGDALIIDDRRRRIVRIGLTAPCKVREPNRIGA